jgi:hypothetical protein
VQLLRPLLNNLQSSERSQYPPQDVCVFAVYRETEPHEYEMALFLYILSNDKFDADLNRAVVHLFGFVATIVQKHNTLLLNRHGGLRVPIRHKRDTHVSQ